MKFTNEQVDRSIETGRLALDADDFRRYLLLGSLKLSLLSIPVFAASSIVLNQIVTMEALRLAMLAGGVFVLTISVVVGITIIKLRSLALETIATGYSGTEARTLITNFSKHYSFRKENNRKNLIIVTTRFTERTPHMRGERLTLIIQDNRIHATSICDPEGSFSFRSLFNRTENLKLLRAILSGTRSLDKD